MKIIERLWSVITGDIGIDLGTANTVVIVKGRGIVLREPSVVAVNNKTKEVLAVGNEARRMIGKTPANIVAIRPLKDGVISDFDTTEAMIRYFIHKVHEEYGRFWSIPRPRVVIGIPSTVTEVEGRAVIDAAKSAGARKAYIIEEPMAAAIGADLPITEASGSLVVDIGGGTTDIAVISLGGIVVDRTIKIAGDEMDQDIIYYIKNKYNLLIGERTAEDVKIAIGSVMPLKKELDYELKGRDIITGLPRVIKVTSVEIREAILPTVNKILDAIKDAIEYTPPELVSDVIDRGMLLAGGGALIRKIDKYLSEKLKVPVIVAADPMACVVEGTAKVLDEISLLERIQITDEDII